MLTPRAAFPDDPAEHVGGSELSAI